MRMSHVKSKSTITLTRTRTLVPVALFLCLAACHSNKNSSPDMSVSASSQGARVGNACALLTIAEASTALGETVHSNPLHVQIFGSDNCTYAVGPDPGNPVKSVDIKIDPLKSDSSGSEEQSWNDEKKFDTYMHVLPVTGLGEDAYFADSATKGRELHVRIKHRVVTIKVHGLKDATAEQDAEKKLAQTAISRV